MKRKGRRDTEAASLSFLDCICCGFGAIVLLLVLSKTAEPFLLEETTENLQGLVRELEEQLFTIRGESRILNRELTTKTEQLSTIKDRIARLAAAITNVRGDFRDAQDQESLTSSLEEKLRRAQQELNEVQRRMAYNRGDEDNSVAGIPVDSEYVIFIIDTSGSMYNYAWRLVLEKLEETLNVYPTVKGIQVMNDMGEYMFSRYRGQWIPDSPARRKAIIDRLRSWNAFSNSSPVEGIQRAITTFYAPDKKISIYVFGDEFTGRSIQDVVKTVDKINRRDSRGNRLVRIHAVGFPVQFVRPPNLQVTGIRFATLMRILCEQNDGTFVGLNDFRS